MTLSRAIVIARTAAIEHGHVLAEFQRDTHMSAVAACGECGDLAAVDVSHGADEATGRALNLLCGGRRQDASMARVA